MNFKKCLINVLRFVEFQKLTAIAISAGRLHMAFLT